MTVDDQEEKDVRAELYNRFREELKRPLSERYYAEDELVAIFDYATDQPDDYIRMEVLFLGMRLYPDSRVLYERRGVLYHTCERTVFENFLSDNVDKQGVMWDVYRLAILQGNKTEITAKFESFLETASFKDDEQVVQFMYAIRQQGLNDWLYENYDKVKAKSPFLPGFLFEIVITAHADGRPDFSIRALEELTEIEPYNFGYWILLADGYKACGREKDALNAIEYALAIDPNNIEALRIQCDLIDKSKPRRDMFKRLVELAPNREDIVCDAIALALQDGKPGIARALLKKVQAHIKNSVRLVKLAIDAEYTWMPDMLDDLYDAGITDVDSWGEIAQVALNNRDFEAFEAVYNAYEDLSGQPFDKNWLVLSYLFYIRDYEAVLEYFFKNHESFSVADIDEFVEANFRVIISMLRLGKSKEAVDYMEPFSFLIQYSDMSRFGKKGVALIVEDIKNKLKSNRKFDWEYFDPLNLGD